MCDDDLAVQHSPYRQDFGGTDKLRNLHVRSRQAPVASESYLSAT
jgi:hypothetical protein